MVESKCVAMHRSATQGLERPQQQPPHLPRLQTIFPSSYSDASGAGGPTEYLSAPTLTSVAHATASASVRQGRSAQVLRYVPSSVGGFSICLVALTVATVRLDRVELVECAPFRLDLFCNMRESFKVDRSLPDVSPMCTTYRSKPPDARATKARAMQHSAPPMYTAAKRGRLLASSYMLSGAQFPVR